MLSLFCLHPTPTCRWLPSCQPSTTALSYGHIIDTNRGDVAAIAVSGVRLQPRDLGVKPSTFDFMSVRVVSGTSSFIAAVVYRPGSSAVSAAFFDESSDVIDSHATFAEPVLLAGDVNIRPQHSCDSVTNQFTDVLQFTVSVISSYHLTAPICDLGGVLGVIAVREDLPQVTFKLSMSVCQTTACLPVSSLYVSDWSSTVMAGCCGVPISTALVATLFFADMDDARCRRRRSVL